MAQRRSAHDQRSAQRENFGDYGGVDEYGPYGYASSPVYDYGAEYDGSRYSSSDQVRRGVGWRDEMGREVGEFFDDDYAEQRSDWNERRMRDIRRSMRGRGPSPVISDDERVRDQICRRMSDDDDLDAEDVRIHVHHGQVTLDGVVEDASERRHAERCAQSVRGVRRIRNHLRTREDEHRRQGEYGRRSFGNLFEQDAGAIHGYDVESHQRRRERDRREHW